MVCEFRPLEQKSCLCPQPIGSHALLLVNEVFGRHIVSPEQHMTPSDQVLKTLECQPNLPELQNIDMQQGRLWGPNPLS